MDLHMPVMDGYSASVQIRKHNINTPIIAITADVMDTIGAKCNKAGINDFITKPINPNLLYSKLVRWISPDSIITDSSYGTTEEDDIHLAEFFPDLDIVSGIRRFGNNKELFLKMLSKFISTNQQICFELRELINKGEFEQAHLKIHTLKGESGNIGAVRVFELSEQIEQSVLNDDVTGFGKELLLLENSVEEITLAVQNYFRETNYGGDKDEHTIKNLINELTESLKSKNPKAFDILDELALKGINRSDIDAINKAVSNNDPDEALILLNKLEEKS